MSPHHHEGYKGPTHPQEVDASVSINIEGVRKKLLKIVDTNDQLEYMDELLTEHGVDHLSTVIWNLHFIIPHDLFLAYKELRNNFFQHFIPTYEAYYNRPYVVQWREKNPQLNQEIENALEPTIRTNISGWDHPYLANRVKK